MSSGRLPSIWYGFEAAVRQRSRGGCDYGWSRVEGADAEKGAVDYVQQVASDRISFRSDIYARWHYSMKRAAAAGEQGGSADRSIAHTAQLLMSNTEPLHTHAPMPPRCNNRTHRTATQSLSGSRTACGLQWKRMGRGSNRAHYMEKMHQSMDAWAGILCIQKMMNAGYV